MKTPVHEIVTRVIVPEILVWLNCDYSPFKPTE